MARKRTYTVSSIEDALAASREVELFLLELVAETKPVEYLYRDDALPRGVVSALIGAEINVTKVVERLQTALDKKKTGEAW